MNFTPAQATERAGVSLDTLLYYEKKGLVPPVARSAGGHRMYSEDDLFWVGFVTCLRDAGLGIANLRDFTRILRADGSSTDKVAFLRGRRQGLQERRRPSTRLRVLEEKTEHYSR